MKYLFNYILSFIIIIIIGLFVLDIVILPIIVNKNNNVYLPDYRQLDYHTAQNKLDSIGFKTIIIRHEYSTNFIPNTVIEMSPRPFTKLKLGRIIKLTVGSEKNDILLENFSGYSLRNVGLKIDRIDLKIDTLIYEYNNEILKNYIISQYPHPGKLLKSGDMITLIVSMGDPPNYYVTPNLINLNLIKAKEIISKAGLLLGKIEYEYNNIYLNNTVLEQNKTPGMKLSFPTRIDLIISSDTQ